jgi:hypothetical protein
MTIQRSLIYLLALATVFSASVSAQKRTIKRTTSKPTTTRSAPKNNVTTLPPLEVRAARVKVSNQYSNVSQFVTLMTPIAQNIEALDNQARTQKISKTSADTNATNKQKLLAAVRGLRAGLETLENEFRTKPDLKFYLVNIQGISDLCLQSETAASAGRFVASVDPLRSIAKKLGDTLKAMPDAEL